METKIIKLTEEEKINIKKIIECIKEEFNLNMSEDYTDTEKFVIWVWMNGDKRGFYNYKEFTTFITGVRAGCKMMIENKI